MLFVVIIALIVATGVACLLALHSGRQRQAIKLLKQQYSDQSNTLAESLQQLALMFSANPYPMWVNDYETLRFVEVNDAAINAYGYSRDEFLDMTLADIRPPEDVPSLLEDIRSCEQGYKNSGVWRHRRKDGSILYAEVMGFVFRRSGKKQKMIVANDVTERRRIEQALRESEASLKTLVDNAPFGIAQGALEENNLRTINPALRKILGDYTLEESLRLDVATQIYADPKERARLLEVLERNGSIQGWETTFRRRDGTAVPVRIKGIVSSLHNGDGTPHLFSSYIEDLTQQSVLEQQVRQVQKLEAIGRLAGGMAHDFNNILVVIKLSAELMLGQITPDSPFSRPLLQISNAVDRAATLTRQMLAFGRQQIMQLRVINLNQVVNETIQMLRRVIGEDIQLITNLAENVENSRLDPDQLTQVILNLAVNARDAMPHGGTLHIETATVDLDESYVQGHPPVQAGRYVMLAVSDTGTGIDRSILPRIFDPFFTTKEVGKGTGLGLAIVYGIVKQSGGYIWVYSEGGHGTTFKMYFPVTPAKVERPPARIEGYARPAGQMILVVDDDSSIRGNVRECLQQLGYRVLEAQDGSEALMLCEQAGKINLVLTDLAMGVKNGHDLANELSGLFPDIPVLFMSGYTEDSAVRREILLRGSRFLQKPFSVAELSKAVHDALA